MLRPLTRTAYLAATESETAPNTLKIKKDDHVIENGYISYDFRNVFTANLHEKKNYSTYDQPCVTIYDMDRLEFIKKGLEYDKTINCSRHLPSELVVKTIITTCTYDSYERFNP